MSWRSLNAKVSAPVYGNPLTLGTGLRVPFGAMAQEYLVVRGAREHNLKNVSVSIPRNRLTVITGLSGSGKSSLAFDTIYAEGQRRYVESLSAYARQFLGLMEKPDVDAIEGLSPAISIEQKTTGQNPRSTVGTVTEIYDYLRLLWARVGMPHCPNDGTPVTRQSAAQITDTVLAWPEETRIEVLAPIVRGRKGEFRDLLDDVRKRGFVRVRVDGETYDLGDVPALNRRQNHDIAVVVDRLVVRRRRPLAAQRLDRDRAQDRRRHRRGGAVRTQPVRARARSSSPSASPVRCAGSRSPSSSRGSSRSTRPSAPAPTATASAPGARSTPISSSAIPSISILEGVILPWGEPTGYLRKVVLPDARQGVQVRPQRAVGRAQRRGAAGAAPRRARAAFKFQTDGARGRGEYESDWEGVLKNVERRYRESSSDAVRDGARGVHDRAAVPDLRREAAQGREPGRAGARARASATWWTCRSSGRSSSSRASRFGATGRTAAASTPRSPDRSSRKSRDRLRFLRDVGLDYLTLGRGATSLSGGETQRIRLATQIGSRLVGVLYILDEPSIGLHQRDNERLLGTLRGTARPGQHGDRGRARRGHDRGRRPRHRPGAAGRALRRRGDRGGDRRGDPASTRPRSRGGICGTSSASRCRAAGARPSAKHRLRVVGARANNLQNLTVDIPLGVFTAVTGVSGSGKSTLVTDILYQALARHFYRAKVVPGAHTRIEGLDQIDKVIDIDQSPIGRTPRSNPATYTGLFTPIRELFTQLPDAKMRGYGPGRFSFNVKGGRCEACQGDGLVKIEMHFLPDVYVPCEVCKGRRYNRETLEVRYKGRSIADVLDLTVADAMDFFSNQRRIAEKLELLNDVGLGYIHLGQAATTLSGGEAQRVKLATELAKRDTGPHALHPRRADHRPPLRGRAAAARGAAPAGGQGEQRGRDRAQPRRHQDRRLDHRSGPGGRGDGRAGGGGGNAGGGGRDARAATPARFLRKALGPSTVGSQPERSEGGIARGLRPSLRSG